MSIKQKVFTFKHSLNRGIHSSPSKISMWNSILQALLTRTRLIKECVIYANDFIIIWRINHNANVTGSNIHCNVKNTAWRNSQCMLALLFYKRACGREVLSHTYNKKMCDL